MMNTVPARAAYPAARVQYAANLLILIGAHLVAVQIRVKLPWGKWLGPEYDAQPPAIFGLLALSLAAAYGVAYVATRIPGVNRIAVQRFAITRQYRLLLVGVALSVLSVGVLLPDVSQLQLGYFAVVAAGLGLALIVWGGHLNPTHQPGELFVHLARLWRSRYLPILWLRYSIQSRYSQTALGILWIVLLPLATAAVLALAFSQFLRIQLDVPFIAFFLSALVPWGLFHQGILNGMQSLLGRMGLINQVYFPREVLVLLVLGEAIVDLCFTFAAMLVVNAISGILPNANFAYLPFLLLILGCFTLGLMLFASCLAVLVRDIPQLVAVGLQLLFYLTPIIYPIESIPDQFRVLVLLNPMASVIQAFRDVIVYNRPPDVETLYYPLVTALALLYLGYTFFKANEERLADLA
jgi:lipopolysaccharide transport system permease protein